MVLGTVAEKTLGDAVLIGGTLADQLGLPLDDAPGDDRCIIVIKSGAPGAVEANPRTSLVSANL
jgi:hypothetical protein